MKKCENCSSLNDGNYGSGRFCSSNCSHAFSTKRKRKEINEKISKQLIGKFTGSDNSFHKSNPNYTKIIKEKNKKDQIIYVCICTKCETEFEVLDAKNKRRTCSTECAKNRKGTKCGGYRKGSGRGKCGWYKGYWCDSSYELAWIIFNIDHNIKFERNTKKFTYVFDGKEKKYIPDFILNQEYVEIKNYKSAITDAKIDQFPLKIKILYKNDLKNIFEYVVNKYGKDFIKLYGQFV